MTNFWYRVSVLIFIISVLLRLSIVLHSSVWLDEAYGINEMGQSSYYQIVKNLINDDGGPLFYFLLRTWILLFGSNEIIVACLPLLFSILTLFFVYHFAFNIFEKNPIVGVFALTIIGFSKYSLFHSANIRYYSLVQLLVVISIYLYWKSFYRKNSGYVYAVVNALGIYTHAFFAFVIISQFITTLIFFRNQLKKFIYDTFITVLLFLPWLPIFFIQFYKRFRGEIGSAIPPLESYGGPLNALFLSIWNQVFSFSANPYFYFPIGSLFFIFTLYYFFMFMKGRETGNYLPFLYTSSSSFLMLGIPILISIFKPIFWIGKFDIIASPAIAYSFGYLFSRISNVYAYFMIILFIAIGGINHTMYLSTAHLSEDRAVIEELVPLIKEGDALIFTGLSGFASKYYLKENKIVISYEYFFPKEQEKKAAYIQSDKFSKNRQQLKMEAEEILIQLEKNNIKKVYIFYVNYPNYDVLLDVFKEQWTEEKIIDVEKHSWGPLYDQVIVLKNGKP